MLSLDVLSYIRLAEIYFLWIALYLYLTIVKYSDAGTFQRVVELMSY